MEFESRGLERTYMGYLVAVRQGDLAAVKLFLADGFSPNARYEEPILVISAQDNQLEVLQALIQAGADVNAAGGGGFQAIHVAAWHARVDIVRELLKAGADPNAYGDPTDEGGAFVPLYEACTRTLDGSAETAERIETVKVLLEHGARVNVYHPRGGRGPLHVASLYGFDGVLRLLLENHAEIEHEDGFGDTPLMAAAVAGQPKAVTVLLAGGAQVNHRTQRGTALLLASEHGYAEVVRLLLKAGADPKLTNAAGKTAYNVARKPEVVRLLRAAR